VCCIDDGVAVIVVIGQRQTEEAVVVLQHHLGTFATDATGQLNILGHDGDALGVNAAQVGIFEESDQIGLGRLLQGQHGTALKAQVALEILGNLTDQTLKGQLTDQQVGTLLVTTNLTERDSSRAVSMGLLHAARGRRGLASGLGRELFARGLASGAFTSAVVVVDFVVVVAVREIQVKKECREKGRENIDEQRERTFAWYEPWSMIDVVSKSARRKSENEGAFGFCERFV
jgi:hypothetical protein